MIPARSRTVVIWMLLAAVVLAPVVVWLVSLGDPMVYFRYPLPPGQVLFVLCKLIGLLAMAALWLQCMLALARRVPVLRDFLTTSQSLHRALGFTVVLGALAHYLLFFSAASQRAGHPTWKLLLPDFVHGHLVAYQGVGIVAFWLLALGGLAGWQLANGRRLWRSVHLIWILVFVLVFLHAFMIGSESRYGVMRYVFIFMGVSLAAATLARLWVALRSHRELSVVRPSA